MTDSFSSEDDLVQRVLALLRGPGIGGGKAEISGWDILHDKFRTREYGPAGIELLRCFIEEPQKYGLSGDEVHDFYGFIETARATELHDFLAENIKSPTCGVHQEWCTYAYTAFSSLATVADVDFWEPLSFDKRADHTAMYVMACFAGDGMLDPTRVADYERRLQAYSADLFQQYELHRDLHAERKAQAVLRADAPSPTV